MSALPAGWRVENLGLIAAVEFTGPYGSLLWCDGAWTMTTHGTTRPVRLPTASTMRDARRIGTAWIVAFESADV